MFLFTMLLNSPVLQAQYYNQQPAYLKANSVWAFGNSAGLDFNSGMPAPFISSYNADGGFNESGCSVAHPETGELFFYFDGKVCWNSDHEIMPNGTLIMGQTYTTTQGAVVVPVIDSPGKYYLFALYGSTGYGGSDPANTGAAGGYLFYSKIDMSLEGGKGDIVAGEKNVILDTDSLSESMIAVPGDNCDVWLIVHSYHQAVFKAYHITSQGIDLNPVLSETGTQIQTYIDIEGFKTASYAIGGMAISPDRQKIAISSCNPFALLANMGLGFVPEGWVGVLVAQFDPATGMVADAIQVEKNLTPYTLSFSPDNSKLYMVNMDYATFEKKLDQYYVSIMDSLAIAMSKVTISTVPAADPLEDYFKLYGDTLYLCTNPGIDALSTINNPNAAGLDCDFQLNSISLAPGTATNIGMPSDVIAALPPDSIYTIAIDTIICENWSSGILLDAQQEGSDYTFTWNDGSHENTLPINNAGTYWVQYGNGCHFRVDTFKLNGAALNPIITVNVFELATTQAYDTYQWMLNGNMITGATNSTYTVTENGDYQVIVSGSFCTDTSEVYEVTNLSVNETGNASSIRIYPNPAQHTLYVHAPVDIHLQINGIDGKILRTAKGAQIELDGIAAGLYFLQIRNNEGQLLKIEKFIKSQ